MSIRNLAFADFKVKNGSVFINPQIMNGNPGIILIHAVWCGHCKTFIPVYKNMAAQLNQNKKTFTCLSIESEELKKDHGELSKALGVEGFPTICWIAQDGKVIGQYKGDRDPKSILAQVCNVYHHCIQYHK